MDEFTPTPLRIIEDLETLKVLADPFRNQMLEILAAQPLTVNEIAHRLGETPNKLYYHINLLEKQGLIQVVDTTVKANIIEKRYWITAYKYELSEDICNFTTPLGQETTLTTMLTPIETTRQDIVRSLQARAHALEHGAQAHPRQVVIFREIRQIPDELADEFAARLKALTEEFSALPNYELNEEVQPRALTIAFYPSFYYEKPTEAK